MAAEKPFTPKNEFLLRHKAAAEELQKHRLDGWLTTAIVFTIAEMAHNGATAEKIAGAREFVFEFQNLFEVKETDGKIPQKSLGVYPPELIAATQTDKK